MNDKDLPTNGPHGSNAAVTNTSPTSTDPNGASRTRRHRRPARTGHTGENGTPAEATSDAKPDAGDATNVAASSTGTDVNASAPTETNRTPPRRRSSRPRTKAPVTDEAAVAESAATADETPALTMPEVAAPEKSNSLSMAQAPNAPALAAPETPAVLAPPQSAPAPAASRVPEASAIEAATPESTAEEQPKHRYRFDRRTVSASFPTSSPATPSPAPAPRELRHRGPMANQWARPVAPPEVISEPEPEMEPQVAAPPPPMPAAQVPPVQPEPEEIVLPRMTRTAPPPRRFDPRPEPEVVVVETIAEDEEETIAEDMFAEATPLSAAEEAALLSDRRGRNRRRRSSRNGNGGALAQENDERPAPAASAPVAPVAAQAMPTAPAARYQPSPPPPPAQSYVAPVAPQAAPEVPASPYGSPEPAHARGFGPASRGIATEYRSPTNYSHSRLNRTAGDGGPPISANQLASIVMEAIQHQTDRLLAEQRRHGPASTFTIAMPSTERVGVFVDVANLLYSSRSMRLPIDFGRLLAFLRGDRRLVRAHAYAPTSPEPYADQQFLQAVKGLGYRITTKDYKTFSSGAKKADLDLDLCMDIVRIVDAKAVDTIVLVSGDSDFLPVLDYCSDHGVRVEVAAFDESTAVILRQSCDLFLNLSVVEEIRADR